MKDQIGYFKTEIQESNYTEDLYLNKKEFKKGIKLQETFKR